MTAHAGLVRRSWPLVLPLLLAVALIGHVCGPSAAGAAPRDAPGDARGGAHAHHGAASDHHPDGLELGPCEAPAASSPAGGHPPPPLLLRGGVHDVEAPVAALGCPARSRYVGLQRAPDRARFLLHASFLI